MARDLSSYISPMIFLEENGAPMEFYIKPGAMKNKVQPLIERGGGMLRSTLLTSQKVIKLADPKEPIEGFVSTDFVFDSVNKQFLQDINKYGLKSKNKSSNRVVKVVNYQDLSDGDVNSAGERKCMYQPRLKYTAADNQAILDYIKKHESDPIQPCGNNLWKKMAAKKVTEHSWQSMRKHYIEFLMKKDALPSKGQLTLGIGSGKRPQSRQESGSARKKSKALKPHSSEEEDSNDTEIDLGNMPSTSRSVSKEQQKTANITLTRQSQKAVESNNDTEEQDEGVETRGRRKATKSSDTDEHEPLDRRMVIRGETTRREERATESNTDMDDQPLSQRAAKMRQRKALGSDSNDKQPRDRRTPTRGKEKITKSNSDTEDPLWSQRAVNKRQHKRNGSTDDQPLHQRATTSERKKATEADVESEDGTSVELAVSLEGNESEHDSDDQSLSRPVLTRSQKDVMDSDILDSQPVPRQVAPVIRLNKSKSPDGKLVSKRLLGTRRHLPNRTSTSQGKGSKQNNNRLSDVDSYTRVTLKTSHEKVSESESETDDFDKRLLAIAEKASFNLSSRKSPNNVNDIESDDETSAKDTQDDEDDEFIFKRKTLRKRDGKTTKNMNNLNPKEKQTDVDETGAVRPTRSQSATKKSSLAQENSVARVNSTAEVPSSESGANKPSNNKNTTPSPDGCSRRLFEEDNEEESTTMTPQAKGKSRKETSVADKESDDDAMWHFIEKMVKNYLNVQKLQCAKGMTRPQILHALYVSNGSLKDTENFIKTGKLTNGATPWSKPENEAILSNDRETVNAIIKKRGQRSVSERRSFLRGCK